MIKYQIVRKMCFQKDVEVLIFTSLHVKGYICHGRQKKKDEYQRKKKNRNHWVAFNSSEHAGHCSDGLQTISNAVEGKINFLLILEIDAVGCRQWQLIIDTHTQQSVRKI